MKKKLFFGVVMALSLLSGCRSEDVRDSADRALANIGRGANVQDKIPDSVLQANRRAIEALQRDRGDFSMDCDRRIGGRGGGFGSYQNPTQDAFDQLQRDRAGFNADRDCRGFGGWSLSPSEIIRDSYAKKLAHQQGVSLASARVIVAALVDLSSGDVRGFERVGLSQKVVARLATGGFLSAREKWIVGRRTGLSPAQLDQFMETLLAR